MRLFLFILVFSISPNILFSQNSLTFEVVSDKLKEAIPGLDCTVEIFIKSERVESLPLDDAWTKTWTYSKEIQSQLDQNGGNFRVKIFIDGEFEQELKELNVHNNTQKLAFSDSKNYVKGKVITKRKAPVKGVNVELSYLALGPRPQNRKTDRLGRYLFRVSENIQDVTITVDDPQGNFSPESKDIRYPRKVEIVNFELKKKEHG